MKLRRISAVLVLTILAIVNDVIGGVGQKTKKADKDKKGSGKKKSGLTGFVVGRLNPDPAFELQRMNGFFSPDEASDACEMDLECAGFTFRGARDVNQKFPVKFFRFVGQKTFEEAKRSGNWVWTSYRVKRSFVAIFHQKSPKTLSEKVVESKSMKTVEHLIEKFGDKKFVDNFKWKFSDISAITAPILGQNSKVSF